jgi:hypothetical protein
MLMHRFRNAALTVCVFAVTLLAAENPLVGTWKLSAEKSKLAGSDALQNVTVRYEMDGESLKASVEGTNAQGQPVNFTYEATLDGKPGTATGAPNFDTIMIRRLTPHSFRATGKKGDKVVFTDRRVLSADGKTLTITRSGTDAQGKQYHSTMVLEKQ